MAKDFSYWELKTWFSNVDFAVIGSGIVGLNCALRLREKHPNSKIVILDKGLLPQGASTKNAGFACFGSISEILEDLKTSSEEQVLKLINRRVQGLKLLRAQLGDNEIGYKQNGGYELFLNNHDEQFRLCQDQIAYVNNLLYSHFKSPVFKTVGNTFNFSNIVPTLIFNPFEGQIDTGKMMDALILKAQKVGIKILNNIHIESFDDHGDHVNINTDSLSFITKKLFIATNGFASKLLNVKVKPARAQVLITKPIKDLKIKGTFHIDRGYYYFRNIDDRILFGGGRELDFKTETTMDLGLTKIVQDRLEGLLNTVILPNKTIEIDHRWSGIMGVGSNKDTIIEPISDHVYCGIRLGGMGIAIGSLVGRELAELSF